FRVDQSYRSRAADFASAWRPMNAGWGVYQDALVVILGSNQLMPVPPCLVPPSSSNQVYASGGSSWIIDSVCTNHMTGENKMFTSYVKNKDSQDTIIFGDRNQGKVKGLGKI
ncbi:hypothetical protein ACJX0J_016796, partial [Zea mays]